MRRLVNRYCYDLDIRLAFTTFNLRNLFPVKDSVLRFIDLFISRVIFFHIWRSIEGLGNDVEKNSVQAEVDISA